MHSRKYQSSDQFRFGRTQQVEFLGRRYQMAPGRVLPVLPHSEHYTALAVFLRDLQSSHYTSVLDLGTGSGVLGLSLYKPGVALTLADLDPNACALARLNAGNDPVTVTVSDWFDNIQGRYDLIIANPPHGVSSDWASNPQVWHLVPKISVDGGPDGCDHIRTILGSAAAHMQGRLALIHHTDQNDTVLDLAQNHGLLIQQKMQVNSVQMTVMVHGNRTNQ